MVIKENGVCKTFIVDKLTYLCEREGIPFVSVDLDGQGGGPHGTSDKAYDESA